MPLPSKAAPVYETTLPTSGKKVKYRPFRVGEQKIALTMAEADKASMKLTMREIVNRCTFEALDMDTLLDSEIEWLFLQIRIRSVGENIELVVTCQHCGHQHDYTINLTEVKYHVDPEHKTMFQISDDIGVEMTYPTSEQMNAMNDPDADSTVTFNVIKSCLKTVFTAEEVHQVAEESDEEIERWINDLDNPEFEKIEKFFATIPTVSHTFDVTCPECQGVSEYSMEGVESFFA